LAHTSYTEGGLQQLEQAGQKQKVAQYEEK